MTENVRSQTDEELVALAQSGDKQATEELLLRHAGLVRGCARGFFLIGGETEDLIQECMIGLCQAISSYKGKEQSGSTFKTFAYLCVSRRIIDTVKTFSSKKNEPLNAYVSIFGGELAVSALSPEEQMILSDERKEFKQKMSAILSDFEFKVVVSYMDGMSCAEICSATGKTAKSVDNAIQRSKKKLLEILKK
jgi:RNA polymerase sporulation-specific sigma factor